MTLIIECEVHIRTSLEGSDLVAVGRKRTVPHLYISNGDFDEDLTAEGLADEVAGAATALQTLMHEVEGEALDNATAFVQRVRGGFDGG